MNRRAFLSSFFVGALIAPSVVSKTLLRRLGPVRREICVDYRVQLNPNRYVFVKEDGTEYVFLIEQIMERNRYFYCMTHRIEGNKRYELEWAEETICIKRDMIHAQGKLEHINRQIIELPTVTITWQEWI